VEEVEYLRVRVVLDLTKPLSRGRTITLRNKTMWVPFKYEKIPKYCFKCGVIRHGTRGCVRVGVQKASSRDGEQEFGPWLRVPSPNRRRGMGGGWNQGGRWGHNQPEKNYGGDQRHQEWRLHEETGGGDSAWHGYVLAGNSTAPARDGCNYDSRNSSPILSKSDNRNKGAVIENTVAFLGGEDTAQTIMGRIYGDRNNFNSEGPASENSNKEKVMTEASPNNGKNIYVGAVGYY
jgi:hypothetical protein